MSVNRKREIMNCDLIFVALYNEYNGRKKGEFLPFLFCIRVLARVARNTCLRNKEVKTMVTVVFG